MVDRTGCVYSLMYTQKLGIPVGEFFRWPELHGTLPCTVGSNSIMDVNLERRLSILNTLASSVSQKICLG